LISELFSKKCFGTFKCWNQSKAACVVAAECRLKRIAEDVKAGRLKLCGRCGGTGHLAANFSIGETGIMPLVPCPVCHGLSFVNRGQKRLLEAGF
jgi:heterodisulfide reductase subunit B